ncbi:hypothetical protein [uncultured Acidaminococcus sp.]|uniref:hypothetical protein n=1 Tax=uncultured Acidaminococcus sp. TaxID=352152 RepID=UPI002664E761|nr:hypothetical protein [uncultured Acidaminococcus sp.]
MIKYKMETPQSGKENIPSASDGNLSSLCEYESSYTMEPLDKKEPIWEIFKQNCACFQAHPVMKDNGPHRFINIY